eukprot:jgi/Botrbrau1/15035/Bobra.320_2s0009.1
MSAKSYLVTGTSRGLGLEFVKQILEKPGTVVIAGARDPNRSEGLLELQQKYGDRLHLLVLDVADRDSIKAGMEKAGELLPGGLDYLIGNAAIVGSSARASEEEAESVESVMRTNFMGFLLTVQAALPLLRKGTDKTVVGITSSFASLQKMSAYITSGAFASQAAMSYKVSKAAMNMAVITLAADLRSEGFKVVAMDPGWVVTDMAMNSSPWLMGGAKPTLDAPSSVAGMLKVIDNVTPEQTGAVLQYTGELMEL